VKSLRWQRLQARPSERDGVMASSLHVPKRRRWLLEGAGAAFQHVLTASTVTYESMTKLSTVVCPIRIRVRAWADSQGPRLLGVDGGPLEAVNAYGVRLLRIREESCIIPTYQ
jgi:hypothetical protein